jgi:hypothetical protein
MARSGDRTSPHVVTGDVTLKLGPDASLDSDIDADIADIDADIDAGVGEARGG